jgi:polyketide cyclase/dehydrase/lipid transport protein
MTIAQTLEVRLARPPAEVFDHLIAVERWPEWLVASGIVRVERMGEPAGSPLSEGSPLRIEQRVAGRSATLEAKVTALVAPTRFAVAGRASDGITVEIDAELAPADPSGTSLRWSVRIGLPMRYRMFESMAAPQVERAAGLDLEAFRRRMESVAGD